MFRKRNDWHKVRSTHASVLESLELVIARHPANSGERATSGDRVDALDTVDAGSSIERDIEDAVVLPFRPRLSIVRSAPDGAA